MKGWILKLFRNIMWVDRKRKFLATVFHRSDGEKIEKRILTDLSSDGESLNSKSLEKSDELRPHVVCSLQAAEIHKMLIRPFSRFAILNFFNLKENLTTVRYLYKLRVDIEHRQVVAFFHCEFSLDHILEIKKIRRSMFHSFKNR